MGEARASLPAVQRLLVACRGSVGQLHPDISREGRIGPILEALDVMTASDVGLVTPPDCAPSRAQATTGAAAGAPAELESSTAGVAGREANGSGSSSSSDSSRAADTSTSSSSSSLPAPFLSLSSWWMWWKSRSQPQSPGDGASLGTAPGVASLSPLPSPKQWPRVPGARPTITYLHVYEDDYFSIGIFCLPKSASIPLHDHPGMSVLSKLLYGSLHVRAFDWAPSGSPRDHAQNSFGGAFSPPRRLAHQVTDVVIEAAHSDAASASAPPLPLSSPSSLRVLHPSSGGNIHAFTALSDCAILDVLTPPYAPGPHGTGRSCTYYHATKASPASGVSLVPVTTGAGASQGELYWLEPCQPPMDFKIQEGRYRGPKAVAALPSKSPPSLASFPMWSFFRRGGMQALQPGQSGAWRLPLLGARV